MHAQYGLPANSCRNGNILWLIMRLFAVSRSNLIINRGVTEVNLGRDEARYWVSRGQERPRLGLDLDSTSVSSRSRPRLGLASGLASTRPALLVMELGLVKDEAKAKGRGRTGTSPRTRPGRVRGRVHLSWPGLARPGPAWSGFALPVLNSVDRELIVKTRPRLDSSRTRLVSDSS